MRRRVPTVTVLLLLVAASACSAEGAGDGTAAEPRSTPAATPRPEASTAVEPAPTAGTAEVDAATTVFFTSPTGNIACSLGGTNAACEIREHDFTPPEKPADCDLDYGTMIGIQAGRSSFLCHGDTAFGAAGTVLAYGQTTSNGLVTCTSRESGMTCSSADGTHGFELSRAAYRLY